MLPILPVCTCRSFEHTRHQLDDTLSDGLDAVQTDRLRQKQAPADPPTGLLVSSSHNQGGDQQSAWLHQGQANALLFSDGSPDRPQHAPGITIPEEQVVLNSHIL